MLSCLVQGFLSCGQGSKFGCRLNSLKRSNMSKPLDLKKYVPVGSTLVKMLWLSVLTYNVLIIVLVQHLLSWLAFYLTLVFPGVFEYNTACGRVAIGWVSTSFPVLSLSRGPPIHSLFFFVCSANSLKPEALLLQ